MAISEVKMRKNELEDITNTNKNYNKKLNMKKVTKKEYRHNKSVSFENYLLTPKDEDYYYNDEDENERKQFDFETSSKVNEMTDEAMNSIPSPGTTIDDNESEVESGKSALNESNQKSTDACQDLSKNPDYIVLTSSLRLLKANKDKISNEIVELSNLLEFFNKCESEEEISKFFSKLINNKLNLPKQNKILKSPVIKISKYQCPELKLADTNNDKPLFRTLNLFNNN